MAMATLQNSAHKTIYEEKLPRLNFVALWAFIVFTAGNVLVRALPALCKKKDTLCNCVIRVDILQYNILAITGWKLLFIAFKLPQ